MDEKTSSILNAVTDQMVLDNLIQGLADEEMQWKVLATLEKECTLGKVLRRRRAAYTASLTVSSLTACPGCPASRSSRDSWIRRKTLPGLTPQVERNKEKKYASSIQGDNNS